MQDKKMNGEVDDDIDLTEEVLAHAPVRFEFMRQKVEVYEVAIANGAERISLTITTTSALCDELARKYPALCCADPETITFGTHPEQRVVTLMLLPEQNIDAASITEYNKCLTESFSRYEQRPANKPLLLPSYAAREIKITATFTEWKAILESIMQQPLDVWSKGLLADITEVLESNWKKVFECCRQDCKKLVETKIVPKK